jgi:hypothetical protein
MLQHNDEKTLSIEMLYFVELFSVMQTFTNLSVFQWSTICWLSVAIAAGLLRRQILISSDSSPSHLPYRTLLRVVLVVVFLPVTTSLFA